MKRVVSVALRSQLRSMRCIPGPRVDAQSRGLARQLRGKIPDCLAFGPADRLGIRECREDICQPACKPGSVWRGFSATAIPLGPSWSCLLPTLPISYTQTLGRGRTR